MMPIAGTAGMVMPMMDVAMAVSMLMLVVRFDRIKAFLRRYKGHAALRAFPRRLVCL